MHDEGGDLKGIAVLRCSRFFVLLIVIDLHLSLSGYKSRRFCLDNVFNLWALHLSRCLRACLFVVWTAVANVCEHARTRIYALSYGHVTTGPCMFAISFVSNWIAYRKECLKGETSSAPARVRPSSTVAISRWFQVIRLSLSNWLFGTPIAKPACQHSDRKICSFLFSFAFLVASRSPKPLEVGLG